MKLVNVFVLLMSVCLNFPYVLPAMCLAQQNEKSVYGFEKGAKHKQYLEAIINMESIEHYFSGEPVYLSKDEKLKENLRSKVDLIIRYIDDFNKENPNNAEVLFYLGKAYGMAHDLDVPGAWRKSVDALERVINLNPKNYMAFLFQGKNYMDSCEFEKALVHYEAANQINPNQKALYFMAIAKMYLKKFPEAKADLITYLQFNPDDDYAKKMLDAIASDRIIE